MRTDNEILEAIKALEENKLVCAPKSCFGFDNIKSIDIMIEVLKNRRSYDWIDTNFESEFPDGSENFYGHHDWSVATTARQFLDGEWSINEILYPE